MEELFSNAFHAAVGTYDVGNPDLEAEINQGIDAVVRVQRRRLDAQLAAYYNRIENYVFPSVVGDTITDEGEEVPLNRFAQRDATLRGLEGRIEGQVLPKIVVGAMGDVVRGTLSGGAALPFLPAARIGGLARWDDGRWTLGTEVRHAFEQDRVSGGEVDIPTAAYTLVNLSAGLNVIRGSLLHTVTLRVDNVLDERYREASSRIKSFAYNPGRNLTLVYRVVF